MGVMRVFRRASGQMTVEVAVALPVIIAVMAIAVNAVSFFIDCAKLDRIANEAVHTYAASPAYGQSVGQSCALVEQAVRSQLDASNLNVSVAHGVTGPDLDEYTVTLEFWPTLFGMGMRSEVFGVALTPLEHRARYVIDTYKPGVIV